MLYASNLLKTFVEAANVYDILRDRHANPTLEVIIDTKLEIFINNSSLNLDFTPKLTHQKSTRQVIQIVVDQPSHDDVVVYHSTKFICDYNCDIWKYQFPKLFPYGHGNPEKQCPIRLGLEAYMASTLRLSSRQFVQHRAFSFIAFDMLACNHVTTFVYVRCKVHFVDVTQVALVSRKNLAIQV
jgi:hypothetical protein